MWKAKGDYEKIRNRVEDKPKNPKVWSTASDDNVETYTEFEAFNHFDIVQDSSKNMFSKYQSAPTPSKYWAKKIYKEWEVLKDGLPKGIYVRVYEDRMDLLRAVIVGSAGTPYHDGLFFFDAYFPPEYPYLPPKLLYHAHGLSINPNLYRTGKVCLSLLNTWFGNGCEKWNPSSSSMLQVLLSIQALVLNQEPYKNEPWAPDFGSKLSSEYTQLVFILSCKTMVYNMRSPPHHFEVLVERHFQENGRKILAAIVAYMSGTKVGCAVNGAHLDTNSLHQAYKIVSYSRMKKMKMAFGDLLMEFSDKGVDYDDFKKIKEDLDSMEEEYKSSSWLRKIVSWLVDSVFHKFEKIIEDYFAPRNHSKDQ